MLVPLNFFLKKSRYFFWINIIVKFLNMEFCQIIKPLITPGINCVTISIFLFILLNNVFLFFCYIFTSSSHLIFTLRIALPLWLGFIFFSFYKQIFKNLSHFLPTGTPYLLIPFIILIEIIRNLIRPGALRVRLAANIVAGHLLLRLLRNQAINLTFIYLRLLFLIILLLLILESAVAVIQSYII
jgi:ATP synthase subunit 6